MFCAVWLQASGLRDLERGNSLERGVRAPLCGLSMLAYHTVVTFVLGQLLQLVSRDICNCF